MAEPLPDRPLVSIIIPVLNEADCLEQTLSGLLGRQWVIAVGRSPGVIAVNLSAAIAGAPGK